MKRFILIQFMLIALSAGSVKSQNAPVDFVKVRKAYEKYKNYSMNIQYLVYNDYSTKSITENQSGYVLKYGKCQYYKMSDLEIMNNEKSSVTVDAQRKILVVSDPVNMGQFQFTEADFKRILKNYLTVEYKNFGATFSYKVVYKPSQASNVNAIEFIVGRTTGLVNKMIFYYRTFDEYNSKGKIFKRTPRMEMVYSAFNPNPKLNVELFKDNFYYTSSAANKYKCTDKYKDYSLIYQKNK